MATPNNPRQYALLRPVCLSCEGDLVGCAAMTHYPDGTSSPWVASFVCHNPACQLHGKAFPRDSYTRSAKRALKAEAVE